MKLELPSSKLSRIADACVRPVSKSKGGLQQFCNVFSDNCVLVNGSTWSVEELFASIAELRQEFILSYPEAKPLTVPLHKIKTENGFMERINPADVSSSGSLDEVFANVIDFPKSYIPPQISEQMKFIVLRPKLGSKGLAKSSFFGNQFIRVALVKDNRLLEPSTIIFMLMCLYALGFLSRYNPELWNPFVNGDQSGEILLVTKFLSISQRYIPNMVLDYIHNRHHKFVNNLDEYVNLTEVTSINQLKKIINEEVEGTLRKKGLRS